MAYKNSQNRKKKSLRKQGFSLIRIFFHKVLFQVIFQKLVDFFHNRLQAPLIEDSTNDQTRYQTNPVRIGSQSCYLI